MGRNISRRHFIHAVTAAAAAPCIWTRTARAAQGSSPNNRIVLGVIGCGVRARTLISRGFIHRPDVQFTAVCDADRTRREAARDAIESRYRAAGEGASFKGCKVYGDYREMLADKDLDAVIIAAPDHWHAILTIEACKAGKDVYCEKPLTLTLHEAGLVAQAVRKHKRVLQTGSQQRSDEDFHKACTLVRNGAIGQVKHVIVNVGSTSRPCALPEQPAPEGLNWDLWLGPAPKRGYHETLAPKGTEYIDKSMDPLAKEPFYPQWRAYREFSGGMMTDWGAHHFDIAQWGLGMDGKQPVKISPPKGEQDQPGYEPLTYEYETGVRMMRNNRYENQAINSGVRFVGANGWIQVSPGLFESSDPKLKNMPESQWNAGAVKLDRSRDHYQNFLDCVRSRQDPICKVEIGASSVSVCHIGNIAWWVGKPLTWDYTKRRFSDSDADKWLDRDRRAPYLLPKID
jgi:predicted dehydrogenase